MARENGSPPGRDRQRGTKSDYEELILASRQEVRQQAIGKIVAQHPEAEVARGIPLTPAALRAGPSFVLDATLEDDGAPATFDGLKRVSGSSKLGDFHYVPMLFHEGRQVCKEQRVTPGSFRPAPFSDPRSIACLWHPLAR